MDGPDSENNRMMLAEVGFNWPAALVLCVMIISVCSALVGKWPFQPGDTYYVNEDDEDED